MIVYRRKGGRERDIRFIAWKIMTRNSHNRKSRLCCVVLGRG
jgi:hypothetical protein